MAQWIKCMLGKPEDLSSIPMACVKAGKVWWLLVIPALGRQRCGANCRHRLVGISEVRAQLETLSQ